MKEDRPQAKGQPKDLSGTTEEKLATHALGATVGAIGGAVAGAIGGLAAGPVGSLAGAVGGAVLGGAAGASTGMEGPVVDTSAHEAYWREHYASRPYVRSGAAYDEYESAYRYGTQAYLRTDHPRAWDEVEGEMAAGWESARGGSGLGWSEAKHAVRDAWERMYGGVEGQDEAAVRSADPEHRSG